ncbi:hypothetical protein SUGI_0541730 [Cryptomeria japonica]|nr:hypothetical protein SUGI_0541730 [Cryptomeria japonica]
MALKRSGGLSNSHDQRLAFTISATISAGMFALLMVEFCYFSPSRDNWRDIIMTIVCTLVSFLVSRISALVLETAKTFPGFPSSFSPSTGDRVQFAECPKAIINADYPKQWPSLLPWVKHSLQDQQVYAALCVLRIIPRKYDASKEYHDILKMSTVPAPYDEAAPGYKPYKQKDGVAIGALCKKLEQTGPYKFQLEQMLVQHRLPKFRS